MGCSEIVTTLKITIFLGEAAVESTPRPSPGRAIYPGATKVKGPLALFAYVFSRGARCGHGSKCCGMP
jgi:hypothetical protein